MSSRPRSTTLVLAALLLCLSMVATLHAQVEPVREPEVSQKVFKHPDLTIDAYYQSVSELSFANAAAERQRLSRLGVEPLTARLDQRSGRFATLMPTAPLVPGRGVGNDLTWAELGFATAPDIAAAEQAAWNAFLVYLEVYQTDLKLNLAELSASKHRLASHDGGDLFQIWVPRQIGGIPVRDSYVSAVIGQGNLTLLSLHQWGDAGAVSGRARISSEQAFDAAERFLDPLRIAREWAKPELVFLPMARGRSFSEVAYGQGYRYQLAWSIKVELEGYGGKWEVLVDANNGAVLANQDQNHYAEAKGGVYPVTNDGINPDGVEQAGWPMPFLNVTTSSGTVTTDTGGNLSATGSLTASLTGTFVRISDNCGTSSLTQTNNLDFGTSTGTDCVTPGFGGAGNTHAGRTGFYELNRIKEMARSHLPSNTWLQGQLTSNMNINQTCNAFWSPAAGTVNFYRAGGGCANTGEIAGVFDHEWGHGMDDNDVNGSIAGPSGEGVADVYAALRLNDSCIGRNFTSTPCSGFGDPCLTCSGVRDIDYLERQSGQPHTYTWANANCGGAVHCLGSTYAEAVWSLWKRKLQNAPFNMSNNTAHELTNRLTFIGAGNVGTWFSGGPPNGGCGGTSGYNQYLAADDDNGNLNDGTPHMTAIHSAFNDQQIACTTPTVQNSGCSGTPSTAPNVTATPGNNQVGLSWGAVSGASSYQVFRAEGIFACDFGKVKVGTTTGTSFNDTGLQNGRNYSYTVVPMGATATCMGPASACDTTQPVSGPPVPDFSIACSPSSFTLQQGASGNSTCTVTATGGFASSVALSCVGAPAGIGCSFAPASLTPTGNSTLTVSVSGSQATGTFNFNVSGTGGSLTRTAAASVTVIPAGSGGPQNAAYDSALGAPKCATVGSSCDAQSLLVGRATLGPEPNQPNTADTCTDGTSGTFHSDESNDRIVVSTLDGTDFAPGKTVRIDATVWAWTTPSSDKLDLYYAANASSPSWTFLTTLTPAAAGSQVLSATYTLPAGSMQAVRARFRYQGSAAACGTGSYDDHDDLAFAVGGATNSPPTANFTFSCTGLSCNFTDTSTDSDGTIVSRAWNFGDGGTSTLQNPSRTYAAAGTYNVSLTVTDNGGATGNVVKPVTVSTAGPQTAVFDTGLQAPRCSTVGISCTTASLVDGRNGKGPEANAPNTINDSCTDGTSGTYHSDESLDRLVVSTVDGTAFAPGKTVRIDATVWAWSTGSSDRLDLYYAANANSPSWVFIGTLTPPGGGARTLTTTYTLPSGTLQAVRGQFRYNSTVGTCSSGGYNDRDDVVFAVSP